MKKQISHKLFRGWEKEYMGILQPWGKGNWRDGKLFSLFKKKNKKMKNIVCINLRSWPYIKKFYFIKKIK